MAVSSGSVRVCRGMERAKQPIVACNAMALQLSTMLHELELTSAVHAAMAEQKKLRWKGRGFCPGLLGGDIC